MAFFEWEDSYSVNVDEMDRQHKRLIDLINHLYEAKEQSSRQESLASTINELDTLVSVIDELVDYTCYHFSAEEEIMLKHEYPEYGQQKREHDQFVKRIQTLQKDFSEGRAVLTEEILQFLRKWWKGHIQAEDKKYGPFFNKKGTI